MRRILFGDLFRVVQQGLFLEQGQHRADHQLIGGLVLGLQLALQSVGHDFFRDALATVGLRLDELGDGHVAFLRQLDEAVLGRQEQGLH